MRHLPHARDLSVPVRVMLTPQMFIFDAIEKLASSRLSAAPVVGEDGRLIGILTEKDCLRVISNIGYNEIVGGSVADYMSEPVATLTEDMDLFNVARQFLVTHFMVLPVLKRGAPIGLVTRHCLLEHIGDLRRSKQGQDAGTNGGAKGRVRTRIRRKGNALQHAIH